MTSRAMARTYYEAMATFSCKFAYGGHPTIQFIPSNGIGVRDARGVCRWRPKRYAPSNYILSTIKTRRTLIKLKHIKFRKKFDKRHKIPRNLSDKREASCIQKKHKGATRCHMLFLRKRAIPRRWKSCTCSFIQVIDCLWTNKSL